jgi:hypothetical protein
MKKGTMEDLKDLFKNVEPKVSVGTPPHNPSQPKKRGVGITRKNKSSNKTATRISKKSRKINRGK